MGRIEKGKLGIWLRFVRGVVFDIKVADPHLLSKVARTILQQLKVLHLDYVGQLVSLSPNQMQKTLALCNCRKAINVDAILNSYVSFMDCNENDRYKKH
ncbi:hypothetical protein L1987_02685 [Smallanthus sonchifolius]|uniref:Uncharacterized protein n=1 Tax=Smallanthus sonchifolius TaxID=185202 RepID=A0ACB9K8N2_9ASTR|nr:hypothetical protein L1987_02685 [Smallanthus sonchifolius]